tara:strand:+ start:168 stop:662 length:495 start_codon:yes stop_codon:yes gene_type:complete
MIIRSIIKIEKYNMITIDELKSKIDKKSRLLGIDIGTKRIGISISDDKRSIALPLKTVETSSLNEFIKEIKYLVNENNIQGLIIGDPINMDGTKGKSSQSVKDKSIIINKEVNIPIILWDERLSTVGAFNLSSQLDINVSKRVKKIDENAATFILQGALDYLNN